MLPQLPFEVAVQHLSTDPSQLAQLVEALKFIFSDLCCSECDKSN